LAHSASSSYKRIDYAAAITIASQVPAKFGGVEIRQLLAKS
jgi:hypothetical protein